jgi:PIN domain nuclease of toxin-antitoxin system
VGRPALSGSQPGSQPGPPYLIDTHVWLWYVLGSDQLPPSLGEEMGRSIGQLWISPMTVWEAGMLHAHGRIELHGGSRDWIVAAMREFPLLPADLTAEVAIRSHEIELGHRDPVDHLIAATALVHDLTLMTIDERMTAADWLPTRSA